MMKMNYPDSEFVQDFTAMIKFNGIELKKNYRLYNFFIRLFYVTAFLLILGGLYRLFNIEQLDQVQFNILIIAIFTIGVTKILEKLAQMLENNFFKNFLLDKFDIVEKIRPTAQERLNFYIELNDSLPDNLKSSELEKYKSENLYLSDWVRQETTIIKKLLVNMVKYEAKTN